MGTDFKSALSYLRDFFTYPSDRVSPEIAEAVNAFNAAMGFIGLKNAALGGSKFAVNLPDVTKALLQENKGLRNLLTAKYIEWKTLITNLDNLSVNEKQMVAEQEKVWKSLLQTLPKNTYLYNPNMATKIRQIVLNSGESMEKFVNINFKAANGVANADEITWLQNFVTKYFPKPSLGDKIRKVLPLEYFEKYQKNIDNPKLLKAGFITKVEDYEIPKSSEEMIENIRLDYPDTKFSKDDGFVVIEYSNKSLNVEHPFNTNQKNNDLPYTNTGMTGSKRNIIPEYYSADEVKFSDDEISKVFDKNGNLKEFDIFEFNEQTRVGIWTKQ